MTREDALFFLARFRRKGINEKLYDALGVAIEALMEQPRPIDPTVEVDLASGAVPRSALNRVTNPPKVTIHMDRPKGHWIRHEHSFWTFVNDKGERGGWIPDYECNLCGSRGWEYAMNFCPNCGARMKGADDE